MNILEKFALLKCLSPLLPYGVTESWDTLDPKLYHSLHIYWLKFYGLWFNSNPICSFMFWIQFLYGFSVLILVCFLPGLGEIVYLIRRRDDIGNIAEGLYLFLSEMYTYFKIAVFWINKRKVLNLLEYLKCKEFRPTEFKHREIILKSMKVSRFVMTWYSTMCVGAVSVGIIMPMTEKFDILPTNVEYPHVDVKAPIVYGILYLHHIYYKPATCIIDGVMDTILAAFIVSAIAQIDILSYNLRNFDKIAESKATEAMNSDAGRSRPQGYYTRMALKDCIIHHNSIIRYVAMIEDAFSLASFLQFMLSGMVLCLVGVQFLSIENPTTHPMQIMWMAIYLTCMLFEVFILCWFGNELLLKSESLRQAAFDGPWGETDPLTRKYVIILMERCQHPLKVTAGKIFTLSLTTYTVLINWSYKAFAVISNM